MMTAVDVSAACRRLLPTLDLDSTTERMVRELVARELGAPIDGHKLLIKVGGTGHGVEWNGMGYWRVADMPACRGA